MSELSESIRLAGQSLQNANMSLLNAALEIEHLESDIHRLQAKEEAHEELFIALRDLLNTFYPQN